MGPKPVADPKKARRGSKSDISPLVLGAKIAWICIGPLHKPLKMVVNLNCPIDILLDYIRRTLSKKLEDEIASLKNELESETQNLIDSDNVQTQNFQSTPSENELILGKLTEIQAYFIQDTVWDLCDPTGAGMNCVENMKKLALDEVLFPGTTYSLAKRLPPDEKGNIQFVSLLADVMPNIRTKTPTKRKTGGGDAH